jgi:hypothetical protein
MRERGREGMRERGRNEREGERGNEREGKSGYEREGERGNEREGKSGYEREREIEAMRERDNEREGMRERGSVVKCSTNVILSLANLYKHPPFTPLAKLDMSPQYLDQCLSVLLLCYQHWPLSVKTFFICHFLLEPSSSRI